MVRVTSCNTEQLTTLGHHLRDIKRKTTATSVKGCEANTTDSSYRFVTGAETEHILRLYKKGMSAEAVAEKLDRPPRTVTDVLRRHGVVIRKPAHINAELLAEMVGQYEAGLSCSQIGKALGINRSTVQKHLVNAKVSLRSKSEAAILRNQQQAEQQG